MVKTCCFVCSSSHLVNHRHNSNGPGSQEASGNDGLLRVRTVTSQGHHRLRFTQRIKSAKYQHQTRGLLMRNGTAALSKPLTPKGPLVNAHLSFSVCGRLAVHGIPWSFISVRTSLEGQCMKNTVILSYLQ